MIFCLMYMLGAGVFAFFYQCFYDWEKSKQKQTNYCDNAEYGLCMLLGSVFWFIGIPVLAGIFLSKMATAKKECNCQMCREKT